MLRPESGSHLRTIALSDAKVRNTASKHSFRFCGWQYPRRIRIVGTRVLTPIAAIGERSQGVPSISTHATAVSGVVKWGRRRCRGVAVASHATLRSTYKTPNTGLSRRPPDTGLRLPRRGQGFKGVPEPVFLGGLRRRGCGYSADFERCRSPRCRGVARINGFTAFPSRLIGPRGVEGSRGTRSSSGSTRRRLPYSREEKVAADRK